MDSQELYVNGIDKIDSTRVAFEALEKPQTHYGLQVGGILNAYGFKLFLPVGVVAVEVQGSRFIVGKDGLDTLREGVKGIAERAANLKANLKDIIAKVQDACYTASEESETWKEIAAKSIEAVVAAYPEAVETSDFGEGGKLEKMLANAAKAAAQQRKLEKEIMG